VCGRPVFSSPQVLVFFFFRKRTLNLPPCLALSSLYEGPRCPTPAYRGTPFPFSLPLAVPFLPPCGFGINIQACQMKSPLGSFQPLPARQQIVVFRLCKYFEPYCAGTYQLSLDHPSCYIISLPQAQCWHISAKAAPLSFAVCFGLPPFSFFPETLPTTPFRMMCAFFISFLGACIPSWLCFFP